MTKELTNLIMATVNILKARGHKEFEIGILTILLEIRDEIKEGRYY